MCCRSTWPALGVDFHIIEQDTYSVVKRLIPEGRTMCSLCSRMRRGALYRYAAENGVTKIALGHHRDDLVETLFLNLFHGGKLKAMAPKLRSEDGRHIVIRPLAYVPERDIARYAAARGFPSFPATCAARSRTCSALPIKKMLAEWEAVASGPHRVAADGAAQRRAGNLADTKLFDFAGLAPRAAGMRPSAARRSKPRKGGVEALNATVA